MSQSGSMEPDLESMEDLFGPGHGEIQPSDIVVNSIENDESVAPEPKPAVQELPLPPDPINEPINELTNNDRMFVTPDRDIDDSLLGDDPMVIDEEHSAAPNGNQNDRSQHQPQPSTNSDRIRQIQRNMIQNLLGRSHLGGAASIFGPAHAQVGSSLPVPSSNIDGGGAPRSQFEPFMVENPTRSERAELERLMRHSEDDDSWMLAGDEADDEREQQEEISNLMTLKKALERRQRASRQNHSAATFNEIDAYELLRVTRALEQIEIRGFLGSRNDHASSRAESMAGDSMGLDPAEYASGDDAAERERRMKAYGEASDEKLAEALDADIRRRAGMSEEERLASSAAVKKRGKKGRSYNPSASRKPRKPRAKTAREVEQDRWEKEMEKERKKREKQAKKAAMLPKVPKASASKGKKRETKSGGRKAAKSAKKAAPPYKSRMVNSWNEEDDVMQALMDNLLHDDMLQNRLAHGDVGPAPVINTRNKESQLAELIASVPKDYDTHRAKTQKKDLRNASKRFGHGKVKPDNGKWLLKGMKSSLYHHQLLAADWMVSRELSRTPPFGGLLADAMGLGKTLEMLATMVGNPPDQLNLKQNRKATLIVVPSSAIKQWMEEIKVHVDEKIFKSVLHFKASKEIPMAILESCDIVVTSYTEVMMSHPVPDEEDMENMRTKGFQTWLTKRESLLGDLHRMKWYRVVLDEAHSIKNYRSRTSMGCQSLDSKFRWAMSGTPILNRLDELFPYFRYLRAEWTNDFEEFRRHFCDPDADDATARVSVVLSIVMMRRTMRDQILGRPIVDLPKPHPETKFVKFSREETIIYRTLEGRFRELLNQHFAAGTAQRNYSFFMVQLLRLRQCTAHPFLLEQTFKDVFDLEHVIKLQADLERQAKRHAATPIFEQIKLWLQRSEEEKQALRDKGEPVEPVPFGRGDFGKKFEMDAFLNSLDEKELFGRVVCGLCGDLPRSPQISECKCIFCKECLMNYVHQQMSESDRSSDHIECPKCERLFGDTMPYNDLQFRDDDDEDGYGSDGSSRAPGRSNSRKKAQRPYKGPQLNNSKWLAMCQRGDAQLLPSAKMIALKATILKWIDESPGDKILIFTQFRMIARIIGLICKEEKWGFVYFLGDMNVNQRHDAVREFHNNPNTRIMIAGLKCGGQALNLTCANRCISVDLWWNHCVEQQAFGRIFRIGQHKETYFSRFVVKDTVDGRLLGLQAHKVKTVDRAMQDDGGTGVAPLSMKDLASLFGHLRTREDGILEVVSDYADDGEEDEGDESPSGGLSVGEDGEVRMDDNWGF